jgi:GAF domain-containing protein
VTLPQPTPPSTPVSDRAREIRLTEALVTLADTLVAGYDLVELMHYLVDTSVEILDAAHAGLVLADGTGLLNVLASSSESADQLEVIQIHTGRGPCIECFTTGFPQSIHDLDQDLDRWPEFAPLALQHGIRSVHAVPMRLRTQTIGALTLFQTQTGELGDQDRRAAQALADIATIGILQQRAADDAATLNSQLNKALATRVVIEQAKGIIAESGGLSMDRAFTALRRYARHHQMSLTELATTLVDRKIGTAQILQTATPATRNQPPART